MSVAKQAEDAMNSNQVEEVKTGVLIDPDDIPIDDSNNPNIPGKEISTNNPLENIIQCIDIVSPTNSKQKDTTNAIKNGNSYHANVDKNPDIINYGVYNPLSTDSILAVAETKSLDDGSESQDEDLKLRWDDDDNDDQMSIDDEEQAPSKIPENKAKDRNLELEVTDNEDQVDCKTDANEVFKEDTENFELGMINTDDKSNSNDNKISVQCKPKIECSAETKIDKEFINEVSSKYTENIDTDTIVMNQQEFNSEIRENAFKSFDNPNIETTCCIEMDLDTPRAQNITNVIKDVEKNNQSLPENPTTTCDVDLPKNSTELDNEVNPTVNTKPDTPLLNIAECSLTKKEFHELTENVGKNESTSQDENKMCLDSELAEEVVTTSSQIVVACNKGLNIVDLINADDNDITPSQDISKGTTIGAKTDHGLNQPDFMLDIPTQELIDIDDADISINSEASDDFSKENLSKIIDSQQVIEHLELVDDCDKTSRTSRHVSKKTSILGLKSSIKNHGNINLKTDDANVSSDDYITEIESQDSNTNFEQNISIEAKMNINTIVNDQKHNDVLGSINFNQNIPKYLDIESKNVNQLVQYINNSKSEQNTEISEVNLNAELLDKNSLNTVNIEKINPALTFTENVENEAGQLDAQPRELATDYDNQFKPSESITKNADQQGAAIESNIVKGTEKATDIDSKVTRDSEKEPTHTGKKCKQPVTEIPNIKTTLIDTQSSTPMTTETVKIITDSSNEVSEITNKIFIESTNQKTTEIDAQLTLVEISKVTKQIVTENANEKVTEIQPLAIKEIVKITPGTSNNIPIELNQMDTESDVQATEIANQPSTSSKQIKMIFGTPDEISEAAKQSVIGDINLQVPEIDVQPSTSSETAKMTPDTSDELPEVTDSLGLLAESSRVMEDDEEPDEEDDDDDDFDQDDESSNQMTAEHSEDSNAQHSESDLPKEQEDKDVVTPSVDENEDRLFQFEICNVVSEIAGDTELLDKDVVVDEIECEEVDLLPVDVAITDELAPEKSADFKKQEESAPRASDIETVKLSDTSDNEVEGENGIKTESDSQLRSLLTKGTKEKSDDKSKQSPSKTKKLEIAEQRLVVNIVDLEESSSEDDIQEVQKEKSEEEPDETKSQLDDVTSVNIPNEIEIMCTSRGGNTSEIVTKEGEVVISGVPKPPPHKPARLNTSEVTIKTASIGSESTLVIPEAKRSEPSQPKMGLEIFNLDSDEDDDVTVKVPQSPSKLTALELETARESNKCINYACKSDTSVHYYIADAATIAYYDAARKRKAMVCEACAKVVAKRTQSLVDGVKDLTPLLDLDLIKVSQELVEISDSDTDSETEPSEEPKETIGETGAKFLEGNLAEMLNETWHKYKMDSRLRDAHYLLDSEIEKLESESKEIDEMLNECQVATDKLRNELYATFEPERHELPAIWIYDTPNYVYSCVETDIATTSHQESRLGKRRSSTSNGGSAKRPAIPLGYTPLDTETGLNQDNSSAKDVKPDLSATEASKVDDDKDVSVVNLSAEAAPADLPPPGELSRAPLRAGVPVYAMRNAFGSWLKGKLLECQPKGVGTPSANFTMCRVRFEHKIKNPCKVLPARCLAYSEPPEVRLTIGTRVIALFKDPANPGKRESYYSGIVAEIPNPVNNYRYLVFFDDGYAQYVRHAHTRLVCECSALVWEEVHPFSREFVRQYLLAYPERPMVRLHAGQSLKTEWNGKWWVSKVIQVDASLVQVHFEEDDRTEWIYRGSTRLAPLYLELQAAERHRARPLPRSKAQARLNMPYVEYTRTEEQGDNKSADPTQQQQEDFRRQRAVAKKSTAAPQQYTPPPHAQNNLDTVTSRVVYYTPKNAVKPLRMTPHACSAKCRRSDVLALKDLRTYNPLAKPLLSGWERQIVRYKGHKEVMYRTPCGRRVRNMKELHRYLRAIKSDMAVDLFDFHPNTHCLAEFVLNKCIVGKKDLSHGKENVPVPCVNYYDNTLPEFCSYNTERTPTAGVPLNLDPEFLCGCDCTNDCEDKSKCACWKMTLEGARTIGLEGPNIGYAYKRLPEPLPSGIYECNSRCKCKQTCLNRVAQHPLQLKLQVFKTLNRGWGIRALNDIPKGSFLCVYAGNLLTDATANLDGLNEGDEYLAELDYIEVVEQMKEGYEEDIPEGDKKLDKKESGKTNNSEEEEVSTSSEDEEEESKDEKLDDDFRPGFIGLGVMEFNKRLRKRGKAKKDKGNSSNDKDGQKVTNEEEDCITISDDEEVREPSRFTAQAGMGANEFISKYRSVRTYFGKDEACYIMDAKVQGNIGRYLNHSCTPNVFVQNVFVDTHDPRFPWVAFFALSHIRAGTELTWNYNYDVGSVPGKVLYCYCGAPNCRGRLL